MKTNELLLAVTLIFAVACGLVCAYVANERGQVVTEQAEYIAALECEIGEWSRIYKEKGEEYRALMQEKYEVEAKLRAALNPKP